LAYPDKSLLGFAAEVIGWAILASLSAAGLLLVIWLADFVTGSALFPARELWLGVGKSFYGKLFVAFILLALIPTALLAVLARGIVVQQLESDVEQEGLSRARVVERFLRNYMLYQTMDASERGVAAVDDGFLDFISNLVDSDIDLYSRGELVATSKRELFASGLLPTRAVPEVFQSIVLDRANHSVHNESVGWFRYLVVSVPIALERWGEPGILSIPLASRQREIERQVTALNQTVLLAAISFSLIAAALAYSLARRISEPINKLTDATRRVAQGDFEISVQASSEDEIGVLSKSFNQMTSDLKRQREHLERTKKLEAWAEMARQVAHEVKNPLTPIQLSTEHLLRVFDDKRVDFKNVLKSCTETILQQVKSLRQISMEFSTFANPTHVEPEPTDLAGLVSETVSPYLQAPPEGVTVEIEMIPDIPSVSVDKRLMQRTLVNLVENALHALNGHGLVAISVQPIEKDGRNWVEVAVADNGEGIEPELQEHIFEPYFSTRASGTGLGLAIARKVVEDHGGTIALESTPGHGTKVFFRLPAVGQAEPGN
jgi:signal transduction histidine kinase